MEEGAHTMRYSDFSVKFVRFELYLISLMKLSLKSFTQHIIFLSQHKDTSTKSMGIAVVDLMLMLNMYLPARSKNFPG